MRASRFPAVVIVAGLAASRTAVASARGPAEPQVELRWSAPPECPDRTKIEAELARFLALGTRSDDEPVVIDADVRREGDRFVLALAVHASAGDIEKTMDADDCVVLASAVALVVAVLLDPAAVVETVERERSAPAPPVVPPPAPAIVPPREPPATPQPEPRKPDVQGFARPFVAASFGALPRFGVATGGVVGVRVGRARLELHAIWEAAQRARLADVDAGARLDLWAVGPRGCFAPRWRTLEVPVCGGAEIGQVRGRGFGLSVSRRARATWAAAVASVSLWWVPRRWIAVGGGLDGLVALTRPIFVVDDRGRVHRPTPAGVRIHAGLELRFP